MHIKWETTENGVRFFVKVVPGSSRTVAAAVMDGMLKVKVAAPPEKGKANQCLTAYLSTLFGVRKNQVQILSGSTSSVKHLQVEGISHESAAKIFDTFHG